MWMSDWGEETINDQITISQFQNVEELIMTIRNLERCGCCIQFGGPERGKVEFVVIKTGNDGENGHDFRSLEVDRVRLPEESRASAKNTYAFVKEYVRRINEHCKAIQMVTKGWHAPQARFVRLMRNGELV